MSRSRSDTLKTMRDLIYGLVIADLLILCWTAFCVKVIAIRINHKRNNRIVKLKIVQMRNVMRSDDEYTYALKSK